MRTEESPVAQMARRMRRSRLHSTAIDCSGNKAAAMARGRWPEKTAENWAAAAGVKPRMAAYWLAAADGSKVSDSGKLALIRELD